jgi:hypothetical protein
MDTGQHGQPRVKLLSAVIGGSAIVAMGALGIAVNAEQNDTIVSDPTTTLTEPAPITTGETSTEASVAPPAPETPVATPEITTTPTSAEPG